MSVILDVGAFVALERDDRAMWRRLKAALKSGSPPMTHGGVIAQVWRGGTGRQAGLARALHAVEDRPPRRRVGPPGRCAARPVRAERRSRRSTSGHGRSQ